MPVGYILGPINYILMDNYVLYYRSWASWQWAALLYFFFPSSISLLLFPLGHIDTCIHYHHRRSRRGNLFSSVCLFLPNCYQDSYRWYIIGLEPPPWNIFPPLVFPACPIRLRVVKWCLMQTAGVFNLTNSGSWMGWSVAYPLQLSVSTAGCM